MDKFRYLEKYVGTYTVLVADGVDKSNPTADDLYIPTLTKDVTIRHTYEDDDRLAIFYLGKPATASSQIKKIRENGVVVKVEYCGEDIIAYFHESDMDKVAKVVRPKVQGRNVHPYGGKSVRVETSKPRYKIPKEDEQRLRSVTAVEGIDAMRKASISRECIREVLEKHQLIEEQKKSGLKQNDFIHSKGLWEEYIKVVKKKYQKELKNNG